MPIRRPQPGEISQRIVRSSPTRDDVSFDESCPTRSSRTCRGLPEVDAPVTGAGYESTEEDAFTAGLAYLAEQVLDMYGDLEQLASIIETRSDRSAWQADLSRLSRSALREGEAVMEIVRRKRDGQTIGLLEADEDAAEMAQTCDRLHSEVETLLDRLQERDDGACLPGPRTSAPSRARLN